MSVVCVMSPVVVAAWPAFESAVVGAAVSMGFSVVASKEVKRRDTSTVTRVELQIPRSEVVTEGLGRDERIAVEREGVTVVFSRDARGRPSLCVHGPGDAGRLRALGEELSQTVVRTYVHQRILDEMARRDFSVVEQEAMEDGSIRMKVRHWEA